MFVALGCPARKNTSKAVKLRVSVTVRLTCVHIISSSVWVGEWPPFGKWLLTLFTVCSLCALAVCDFSYFPFWF